jgi:dihydroorotate dehydrogenase (NAD+) catalytic subunit
VDCTYDIAASYLENFERGPQLSPAPDVSATPTNDRSEFLGFSVNSRLGIAAGLLLNAKWIEGFAARGWDLLTYKTVRSAARECYPPPNWAFVNADAGEGPVFAADDLSDDPSAISSAVCFGMPSMPPEFWREDIARAKASMGDGQMLIVSVVASPEPGWSGAQVADDYAQCAAWAAEAGADVIEANYSCPNVCSAEGQIYCDADLSKAVTQTLRAAIGDTPLLLKIGVFPNAENQRAFLHAVAGNANGITLVNGISRPVLHADGRPVFGKDYVKAGVMGRIIHDPCVAAVREARAVIGSEKLPLALAAVGGVSSAADFEDFMAAGADVVMCGSSPMYLPDLAVDIKRSS